MKEFWNDRYSATEYAYGEQPNLFFEKHISELSPGKILFPAEGEGRNAVFAARLGWESYGFDISEEGKRKALLLAQKYEVSLQYDVFPFSEANYPEESFDALVLIFAHFPEDVRPIFHRNMLRFVKPGGTIILEAFRKEHLSYNSVNPQAGGPKDASFLHSEEELRHDFSECDITMIEECDVELSEGEYHVGKSAVVRMIAQKR